MLDLNWSDDYLLGIEVIDQQHRQLFGYFEEIERAIAEEDSEAVVRVARGLVDYAISHNTFEESLMEQANYPDLEAHHKLHETFKGRVTEYLKRLDEGSDPFRVADQVRVYIGLWLISHVKQEDREYVPYVNKIATPSRSFIQRFFGRK